MRARREGGLILAGAVAALGWVGGAPAREADVPARVKELIAALADPEARGRRLNQTVAAQAELTRIGAPAAPQLVDAVVTSPPASNVGWTSGQILLAIGRPALPAIRAEWGDLNDERRWRLMPVLEKHAPESVRVYALNCLDSDGPVRLDAWQFVVRAKDPRAKDRYYDALTEHGKESKYVRWQLLPTHVVAYDEDRETKLLIDLLGPNSWVAKGEGQPPWEGYPPPWWPDGRPAVIQGLHERRVTAAAPALLKVLEEKGPGLGYLAEQIVPALADLNHTDAIPELERIAASKPAPGQREDRHPYALGGYKDVRRLASDAAAKLKLVKR